MAEFTYCPFLGANVTKTPRVRTTQFGDGYMQRVGDGINTAPREWQLQFKGSQTYMKSTLSCQPLEVSIHSTGNHRLE